MCAGRFIQRKSSNENALYWSIKLFGLAWCLVLCFTTLLAKAECPGETEALLEDDREWKLKWNSSPLN